MSNNQPIGVFDSGVGGITVLRALKNLFPQESYIYFGDTGRVPYGSKSPEIVSDYSVQISSFLKEKGVKALVIACNTATAMAGKILEDLLGDDLPVVGVIKPAIRESISISQNGRIGVIGTKNTIESDEHRNEILSLKSDLEVWSVACPMIVPYIEEDETDSPGLMYELTNYLGTLREREIDTLVLGCTHYPLIKGLIQKAVGEGVSLVDPGIETAKDLYTILESRGMLAEGKELERTVFYITGGVKEFKDKLERFGLPKTHIHQVGITELKKPPMVNQAETYEDHPDG